MSDIKNEHCHGDDVLQPPANTLQCVLYGFEPGFGLLVAGAGEGLLETDFGLRFIRNGLLEQQLALALMEIGMRRKPSGVPCSRASGRPVSESWGASWALTRRQMPRVRRRLVVHYPQDVRVHRVHAHHRRQLQQALLAVTRPHGGERVVADLR